MEWLNLFGIAIVAVLMIPNIIFALRHKEKFANDRINKKIVICEQVDRYGYMVLMIINLPFVRYGFYFEYGPLVYLYVNIALCIAYCIVWTATFGKNNMFKAVTLSVLPSVIFLFSGIITAYYPLIAFAVLFAVSHIYISCKNVTKT